MPRFKLHTLKCSTYYCTALCVIEWPYPPTPMLNILSNWTNISQIWYWQFESEVENNFNNTWGWLSSGILYRVVSYEVIDVSEVLTAFKVRAITLRDYTAQHPRRQSSSFSPPWEYETESRVRVVNISVLYSGGPRFISRPEDRLYWLRIFVVSPSLQANARIVYENKATAASFSILSNSSFTYPFIRRYSLYTEFLKKRREYEISELNLFRICPVW
jgi:hypothetical protein